MNNLMKQFLLSLSFLLFILIPSRSAYAYNVYFTAPTVCCTTASSIRVQWNYIPEATQIRFDVSSSADFSSSNTSYYAGNTIAVDLINLPQNDNYVYVRVTAYDSYGGSASNWFGLMSNSFIWPGSPALSYPYNYSYVYGTSADLYYSIPAYSDNMQIIVGRDPYFSNVYYDSGWTGYNHDHTWLTPLLDDGQTYYWKVRSKNWSGVGNWSETWLFTNGNSYSVVPTLSSPGYGTNISGSLVNFYWQHAAHANNYYLQVARDSFFNNISCSGITGYSTYSYCTNFLDDGQTYYWRLKSSNFYGESGYSSPMYFRNGNQPPSVPYLEYPLNENAAGGEVLFSWTAAARTNNYTLQIADDPYFTETSLVYNQNVGNSSFTYAYLDDNGAPLYWRVIASNFNGSTVSGTGYFVNGPSSAPPIPEPWYPSFGASITGTSTLFGWSWSKALTNRLEVATGAAFQNKVVDKWVGATSFGYMDLKDNGTSYYWRVTSSNPLGSSTSATYTFINTPSAPAAQPALVSPSNLANTPGKTVALLWGEAQRANDYHLQVALDPFFTNKIIDEWVGDYYDGYDLSTTDNGTVYYWRVEAKNTLPGTSGYSESRSFINGPSAAPPKTVLVSPHSGQNATGNTINLSWNPTDRATYYRLQLLDSASRVIVDRAVGTATSTSVTLNDDGQSYSWRVIAGNSLGTTMSDSWTFVNGPSAPTSTPVLVYPGEGNEVSGMAVSFQWLLVDRADNYQLQVATDVNFSNIFYNQWMGNVTQKSLTGFTENGQHYWWRVKAKNSQGESGYSTVNSFYSLPPVTLSAPSLVAPVAGTNIAGTAVTFSWQTVAGANSYVVQISNDNNFVNIAQEVPSGGTSATISGFDNVGHIYFWRVAAVTPGNRRGLYSSSSFTNGALSRSAETPLACIWNPSGSSTNVATGALAHDQELFTVKGGAVAVGMQLFYSSLPVYTGPLGPGWSHSYDISLTENADGSIILRDGSGNRSFYPKSGSIYVAPQGDFSSLAKNGDATFTVTYRDGRRYNFSSTGKLTAIIDRFNNSLAFSYTGSDLTSIADTAGRATTFSYDQSTTPHRISTVTDPNQNVYDFSYQGNNLYRVTNPAATTGAERGYWEYHYDPQGFLTSKRDPNGNITQYTYYADHKMQLAIDPEGLANPTGHTRTFNYPTTTANLRTTTFIERDGGSWLYTYDVSTGVIKSTTDPNGKITTNYYYPNGFIKAKTVPRDGTTRLTTFFTYDSYGNVLSETEPSDIGATDPEPISNPASLGLKIIRRYSYDNANYDRLTSISDERGATTLTTAFAYTTESGGEVITATATPGNYTAVTKKNPNGTVKQIIDANLKSTTFTYYPETTANRTAGIVGLLESSTDPAGITTTVTSYDKTGSPLTITVKNSAGTVRLTSTQQHDTLNRMKQLTKTATDITLPVIATNYGYDLTGNLNSLTDAESHTTTYQYNYNRQVTKVTDAKQNDTVFTYSGSGCGACGAGVDKLIGVYDANAAKKTPLESQPHTAFSYDMMGRLDTETDSLNKKLHYTYYDNGQLKEIYDATASAPGTLLATLYYNNRGQLTDKTFTDGTAEHYTYTANGQLQTASNQNISYTYAYYTDGRLQTVTDTTNNRQISYDQFDNLGQRKQVTILKGAGADQRIITYDYDAANRPWHITSTGGTFTFLYDTLGRRDTLTYPNTLVANWDFDDLNRLTAINHKNGATPFANFSYDTIDKIGNRKSVSGSKTESYGYDELYRLLTVTSTKPESFTFDAAGNRQSGPTATSTGYQHNAANQMTQGQRFAYTYDNRGNQTTKTMSGVTDKTWTHTWDYNNRIIKEEKLKGSNERRTVTYKYDPFGRRIEKKFEQVVDGVTETETTTYIYDNEDIVVEYFTTAAGTEKTFYTHGTGIDEPLALERSSSYYYYHADGLGSITHITNTAKTVVQSYEYESYGRPTASTFFRNPYQFQGREYDGETGLVYYRGRSGDPNDGNFTSKDPIGIAGGVNLYQFLGGNVINLVDPWGLDGMSAAFGVLGFVSNLATLAPHPVVKVIGKGFSYAFAGASGAYATYQLAKDEKVSFSSASGIALATGDIAKLSLEKQFPMSAALIGMVVSPLNNVSTAVDVATTFGQSNSSKPQPAKCKNLSATGKQLEQFMLGY